MASLFADKLGKVSGGSAGVGSVRVLVCVLVCVLMRVLVCVLMRVLVCVLMRILVCVLVCVLFGFLLCVFCLSPPLPSLYLSPF